MKVPKAKPLSRRENARITQDLLGLVDLNVPIAVILSWPKRTLDNASEYAVDCYLSASDNDVKVRKMPLALFPFRRVY